MERSVEIILKTSPVYGYNFARCGFDLIKSISLLGERDHGEKELFLELSFSPELFYPVRIGLERINSGINAVDVPRLEAVSGALLGCEKDSVLICCTVFAEGEPVGENTVSVPLYPYDGFCASDYPAINCVFVTPESEAVGNLAKKAAEISGEESYRGREAEIFENVYSVIKTKALTYSIHPFVTEKKHQRIELPASVLRSGNANSAQMAFLFASVLERLGEDGVLVFLQNTVLTGMFVKPFKREFCEIYSKQYLLNAIKGNKLILCDGTGACYGADIPFALSCKNAYTALEQNEFAVALDVAMARKKGITPVAAELYESRDRMNSDILADDLSGDKSKSGLWTVLAQSDDCEALCDLKGGLEFECDILKLEKGSSLEGLGEELCGACLCGGMVEYCDPVSKKSCFAPSLLAPLGKNNEDVVIKQWVVNTLLLEKLSLGGVAVNELKEIFTSQGKNAFLSELEIALSMCEFASLRQNESCVCFLAWEKCLYFDSCKSYVLPSQEDEVCNAFCCASFDKEFQNALESALRKPVTRVCSEDTEQKKEFIRALMANMIAEDKTVLCVTERGDELKALLDSRESEEKAKEQCHGDYLDAVFSVGACGLSFDSALAGYEKYSQAPREAPLGEYLFEGIDAEGIKTWSETVGELADAYEDCGGIKDNPLRWIKNPAFSTSLKQKIKDALLQTIESLDAYLASGADLFELLQTSNDCSYRNLSVLEELSELLAEGDIPRGYFLYVNKDLDAVIKAGKMHRALCSELEKGFTKEVYKIDAGKLLEEINRNQCSVVFKKNKALNAAVRELRGYSLHPSSINNKNVSDICRSLVKCDEYYQYIISNASYLNRVFSVDVLSPDAVGEELWEQLDKLCERAKMYERLYLSLSDADAQKLSAVLRLCCADDRFLPLKNEYFCAKELFYKNYGVFCELVTFSDPQAELCDIKLRLVGIRDSLEGLENWTRWLVKRDECAKLGLACVCEQCESGEFSTEQIRLNFVKGFFAALLRFIASKDKRIEPCDTSELLKRVENAEKNIREAQNTFLWNIKEKTKPVFCSVTDAHLSANGEFDLVILDCAEKMTVFEALPLLGKGVRACVISSSFDGGFDFSFGKELDRLGIERTLLYSVGADPYFDETLRRFAMDRGGDTALCPYPPLSLSPSIHICRVNGGYDDKSATNVIEASVVCDMITNMTENGVKSICVVTLGEEQKSLITAVLAKRLNALAQLKEKFIEQVLPGFAVVTLEEGVFSCEKMIFATCFSCAEGGYARGISPRIAEKLGTDCSTALAAILRAPKSDLTVTCAFSPEELHNTRMFIESVESFKSFMTRLFFMSGLAFPHSLEKGDDPIIESVYEHLCKKGFTLYKNCGFSRFKTDLLLIDGQTPCRVAALITGDKSFKKLCDDPRKAQLWISGFYKAGVEIFYISDACWFGDKQDTLKKLEEFCRRVLNTDLSDPIEESYEGV